MTLELILKDVLSAGVIALVSDVVRRNDRDGALLASLGS